MDFICKPVVIKECGSMYFVITTTILRGHYFLFDINCNILVVFHET